MNDENLERRAEEILADVVDLRADARSVAAERACGGEVELLARVRTLLVALDQAGGFLGRSADDMAVTAAPSGVGLTSAPIAERPGSRIDRYKLLEQIGEGGFGVVFRAEQERPVRRQVAVKIIKLGMDTREVVARFEAERQALAMMDHPNIARVFDAGSTEAGRPYFVMELVRGSPITDYADKNRLTTAQRVALAADVCRAVQHAHSKGVIHRDLKPTNVLVTTGDDGRPVPKVIDFGIAKATQAKLTEQTLFTAFRQLIGTPQYMSPEQADSDGTDIDTRTDVYSLGVVLYELLVGTTPIDARQLRSAAYDAMRKMIRDEEPAKPSTKLSGLGETLATVATNRGTDAKRLGQQLHGELDWIVMRALEKDRRRRYETAAALADDLGRYLGGDAVLAGPVSGFYRLRKLAARHKGAIGVAVAVVVLLILGITGTTIGLVRESRQRREAVAQRQIAESERQTAQAVAAFLTDDLMAKAKPEFAHDHTLSETLIKALIEPAVATVDRRFNGRPVVRAAIQETVAETYVSLDQYHLAEAQAKAAWETRRAVLGVNNPDTLISLRFYGWSVRMQDRSAEAEPLLRQSWDGFMQTLGEDNVETLKSCCLYSSTVSSAGRWSEAEPLQKRCWEHLQKTRGENASETLLALGNYAWTMKTAGRFAEAEPLYKKCWDMTRVTLGEEHPRTLWEIQLYAETLDGLGRHAEAQPLFKRCWEAKLRVLGDSDPITLDAMLGYGGSLYWMGNYAQAETLIKRLFELRRRAQGADSSDTLTALNVLAIVIDRQGRHVESAGLFKQYWEANQRLLGEENVATLGALNSYAAALKDCGNYVESRRLYDQCMNAAQRTLHADTSEMEDIQDGYAGIVFKEGRYQEAERLFKTCYEAAFRSRGNDSPDALEIFHEYAIAIDMQGRHDEALKLLEECRNNQRRVTGDDHPDTIKTRADYGHVVDELGRHAEAENILRETVGSFQRVHPDSGYYGEALLDLGRCLTTQRKWGDAEPFLRENVSWYRSHASADLEPMRESVTLLNQCLTADGKRSEPATLPTTGR